MRDESVNDKTETVPEIPDETHTPNTVHIQCIHEKGGV